jgi:hypothetical protein
VAGRLTCGGSTRLTAAPLRRRRVPTTYEAEDPSRLPVGLALQLRGRRGARRLLVVVPQVAAGPALTVGAGVTWQRHVDIRALALGAGVAGVHGLKRTARLSPLMLEPGSIGESHRSKHKCSNRSLTAGGVTCSRMRIERTSSCSQFSPCSGQYSQRWAGCGSSRRSRGPVTADGLICD